MRPHVRIRFAFAALPLVFSVAACSTPSETTPDNSPAVAVTTVTASQLDWPAHFDAGGVLRARTTATIASRLLAPVLSVKVRPGDRVKQGQTLIELDAAGLGAQATRAAAAVTAATSGAVAAGADVEGADAAVVLAKATHASENWCGTLYLRTAISISIPGSSTSPRTSLIRPTGCPYKAGGSTSSTTTT